MIRYCKIINLLITFERQKKQAKTLTIIDFTFKYMISTYSLATADAYVLEQYARCVDGI